MSKKQDLMDISKWHSGENVQEIGFNDHFGVT